eukprot:4875178-Amphidinium_carterae.1
MGTIVAKSQHTVTQGRCSIVQVCEIERLGRIALPIQTTAKRGHMKLPSRTILPHTVNAKGDD